jgi:hypothetical protein
LYFALPGFISQQDTNGTCWESGKEKEEYRQQLTKGGAKMERLPDYTVPHHGVILLRKQPCELVGLPLNNTTILLE